VKDPIPEEGVEIDLRWRIQYQRKG